MGKIYYIANARMPTERAHGIQIAKMCEAFIQEGIDLELVVPRRKTYSESIQRFYGLRVPIRATRLPVIDWYGRSRFGFFIGSCSFMVSYFFYILWKRIRGEKGILYTIDIDQFSFLFAPFLGMPCFAEIHDAKKRSIAFSALFRRAKGVIVINGRIRETLIREFGIAAERIAVHPNGVDIEKFSAVSADPRRLLGLPPEKPIALYAGKLYGWKGAGILADAAEIAKDILFCVVGGDAEEFKKITGRKSLPENLICAGQKKYEEIPLWMHAANALIVLGTKGNEYSYLHTSPMKMFEYMATGKPVIAARTPANEQIATEQEVIFYMPDDANDFAEKVRYVCEISPDALREKTEKARKKAEEFSWENRAKRVISFMREHI